MGMETNLNPAVNFQNLPYAVEKSEVPVVKEPGLDSFDAKLKPETPEADTVTFKQTKGTELSKEDKQAIMKKARKTAAGWSILGNLFSTAYFGLRSDATVAKEYNLDAEKDKDFIHNIKRQQTIQTIPSLLFNIGGIAAWIYNTAKNPGKLDV